MINPLQILQSNKWKNQNKKYNRNNSKKFERHKTACLWTAEREREGGGKRKNQKWFCLAVIKNRKNRKNSK